MSNFMREMEGRLREDITSVKTDVEAHVTETRAAVAELRDRVDQGEQDLLKKIEDVETRVTDKIEEKVVEKLKGILPGMPGPSRPHAGPVRQSDAREECFWKARRSLRMWPLRGDSPRMEVQAFLLSNLGFDASFVNTMGTIEVVKIE